jgi:hypothetical protein
MANHHLQTSESSGLPLFCSIRGPTICLLLPTRTSVSLFRHRMSVIQQKKSSTRDEQSTIGIKTGYLFKSDPCSLAQRLRVVRIVILCIPVPLVVPFSVSIIFLLIFFRQVALLIVFVIRSILFIQFFKTFFSE